MQPSTAHKSSFWRNAFTDNSFLWFHIVGGGTLAKIFHLWIPGEKAVLFVLVIALGWELRELYFTDIKKIYGSHQRFFQNAFGDVVGALFMAVIVSL